MLLIFHLLNIVCSFPRLFLKGIDFTTGHLLFFSPVGFKGNLSLLEIFLFFPGVSTKWKWWLRNPFARLFTLLCILLGC